MQNEISIKLNFDGKIIRQNGPEYSRGIPNHNKMDEGVVKWSKKRLSDEIKTLVFQNDHKNVMTQRNDFQGLAQNYNWYICC